MVELSETNEDDFDIYDRQQEIRTARNILSDERLSAFFRAVRKDEDVLATKLINDEMDSGSSLEMIFDVGDEFGFVLSVKVISESKFNIAFGGQAGELTGDGGNWIVTFKGNSVYSIEAETIWIS